MAGLEDGAFAGEFDGASHVVGDVEMGTAPPAAEEPLDDLDAPAPEAKAEEVEDQPMDDLFGEGEAAADAEDAGEAAQAERCAPHPTRNEARELKTRMAAWATRLPPTPKMRLTRKNGRNARRWSTTRRISRTRSTRTSSRPTSPSRACRSRGAQTARCALNAAASPLCRSRRAALGHPHAELPPRRLQAVPSGHVRRPGARGRRPAA
jgi:hypothetical protein